MIDFHSNQYIYQYVFHNQFSYRESMLLELKDVISIAAKRCIIREMCLEMVQ